MGAFTPEEKKAMVKKYYYMVRLLAKRMIKTKPLVDFDDLVSFGGFGFIDALDRFDPSLGYRFINYAQIRIWGAMLDGLRSEGWIPRTFLDKNRDIEKAVSKLRIKLNRNPEKQEVAKELGLSLKDYHKLVFNKTLFKLSPLDQGALFNVEGSRQSFISSLQEYNSEFDPLSVYENKEDRKILAKALASLSVKRQKALYYYFYEGKEQKEIGDILGVDDSAISQRNKNALRKLREIIEYKQMQEENNSIQKRKLT